MGTLSLVEEYRQALNAEPKVYRWLAERGLYHSAVEKFRLGYDGERLTIPYFDWFGRVRDMARRTLEPDVKPKYLREEHLPFMVRSANQDWVILCEGELDTITAHMAGYKAMGVPGATAWQDIWGYLLRDCSVTIAFDGDDAGRKATMQVFQSLKRLGVAVDTVSVPEGHDINSLWVAGGKKALWQLLTSGKDGLHVK